MTTEFAAYLRAAMSRFATQKEFAQAIGVDATHVSRALKGKGAYTFNVENCLRLANVADRPPAEVLRAAGKLEIADLLDALYPTSARPLPHEQRALLERWGALNPVERELVRGMMDAMLQGRATRPRGRPTASVTRLGEQPPPVAGRRRGGRS